MMFDNALDLEELLTVYSALLVPLVVAQLFFLIAYLVRRIKKG